MSAHNVPPLDPIVALWSIRDQVECVAEYLQRLDDSKSAAAAPSATVEHTPGPWFSSTRDGGDLDRPIREVFQPIDDLGRESRHRYRIADVRYPTSRAGTVGAAEREGNAALIAAAPELADALASLMACPIVAGLGAAIRDHARHNGVPNPIEVAATALRKAGRVVAVLALFFLALPLAAGTFPPGGTDGPEHFDRPAWAKVERVTTAAGTCWRDTRAVALKEQCRSVVWDARGCHVLAAVCQDLYSGAEVSTDSARQALQVDHLYPASKAWRLGTWKLDIGKSCSRPDRCPAFERFYNDRANLTVTRSRTNASKGDSGPDGWCPADRKSRFLVAYRYRATALKYRLPISAKEEAGLRAWERGECLKGERP